MDAQDIGSRQFAGEKRVFAEILEVPAAERIPLDVDGRTKQDVDIVIAAFLAEGLSHLVDQVTVETACPCRGGGETGRGQALADAGEGIARFIELPDAVGAVGKLHGAYPLLGDGMRLVGFVARQQPGFFQERQLFQCLFHIHGLSSM